jgi:hypothetical protein
MGADLTESDDCKGCDTRNLRSERSANVLPTPRDSCQKQWPKTNQIWEATIYSAPAYRCLRRNPDGLESKHVNRQLAALRLLGDISLSPNRVEHSQL